MSGDRLEEVLGRRSTKCSWLKAITTADVKGRIGPSGTEGLLVTFERSS